MKRVRLYIGLCIYGLVNYITGWKFPWISINLALVYDRMGRIYRAARIYHKVIKLHPQDPRAYYGIAILYDNKKRYEDAITWYKKSINVKADYIPACFFMANACMKKGIKPMPWSAIKKLLRWIRKTSGLITMPAQYAKN
ncbi:tetratricopeptide repeat protein [Thermoclostridium stercorarium]|uniref:tetratricopeptide repeat protein n=1 Tax=Thermoclostridium stercorarium TaxID=1510 RepID=UPI000A406B7A|nr:tetratricopeptide repeat protein [Thermoclostridium stercorarium]